MLAPQKTYPSARRAVHADTQKRAFPRPTLSMEKLRRTVQAEVGLGESPSKRGLPLVRRAVHDLLEFAPFQQRIDLQASPMKNTRRTVHALLCAGRYMAALGIVHLR